jgi:predicted transcriptional regulator
MSDRHQTTPFPFRMEQDVRDGVEALAKSEDRSRNWLLNRLIRIALPLWGAKKHKSGEVGG